MAGEAILRPGEGLPPVPSAADWQSQIEAPPAELLPTVQEEALVAPPPPEELLRQAVPWEIPGLAPQVEPPPPVGLETLAPVPALIPAPEAAPSPLAQLVETPPLLRPPQPEPAPIPRTAAPEQQALELSSRLDALSQESEQLRQRRGQLETQFATAQDEDERARLQQEAAQVDARAQQIAQERVTVGAQLQDRGIELQSAVAQEQLALQAEMGAEVEAKRAEVEAQKVARAEKQAATEQQLRRQMEADREQYRQFLENPPAERWNYDAAQALVSTFTEVLAAAQQRRPPNFGPIADRFRQANKERYQQEAQRKLQAIGLTGDQLTDARRLADEENAQAEAAQVAFYADLERRFTERAAQVAEPLQRVQYATAAEEARIAREQAERQAMAAREEADRKRQREDVELRLKGAQVTKTEAEGRKAEAEAAKAEKRLLGGGGGSKVTPGLIQPNVVPFPGSDRPLVTLPDTPQGRAEASKVRAIVTQSSDMLSDLNLLAALVEDADEAGWKESIGLPGSPSNADFDARLGLLKTKLAQAKAGPGKATTEGDDAWAAKLLGLDQGLKAWSSYEGAVKKIDAVRLGFESLTRSQLQAETRLDSATREKVIAAARVRRESKARATKRAEKNAPTTLRDESRSTSDRVAAADLIEEKARADHGDDWLDVATDELTKALVTVEDPEVAAELDKRLRRYQTFAKERTQFFEGASKLVDSDLARQAAAQARVREDKIAQARTERLKKDLEKVAPEAKQSLLRYLGLGEDE